jgi:hypothetical protein
MYASNGIVSFSLILSADCEFSTYICPMAIYPGKHIAIHTAHWASHVLLFYSISINLTILNMREVGLDLQGDQDSY